MKIIDNISKELWDEIISESDHATFFHSHTWANIISKSMPHHKVKTKCFIFDDGTKAILPLILLKQRLKGFVKSYYSVVPGVYGGLISNNQLLDQDKINRIFDSLKCLLFCNFSIVGNPLCNYEIPGFYKKMHLFTQIVDLKQGHDAVFSSYTRMNKQNIRKAQNAELKIDYARSLDDYKDYYQSYGDCLKRWGDRATNRYSFDLFKNIFEAKSPNIKLWLVKKDEKIIGGLLIFYCSKHVVAWHGSSLRECFKYRPNNFVHAEVIRDACEKNYWYYDFNPSCDHEGVVNFKRSFGTKRFDLCAYYWASNFIYKNYLRLRTLDPFIYHSNNRK